MIRRKYQNLFVWQKSMELVTQIYDLTRTFPDSERFGLTSQLRRASVSVPSNIAEGSARGSDKDFCRFLYLARGSLTEIETQLVISQNLGFCKVGNETDDLIQHTFALLNKLIHKLS